jgi:hypothetical protein
VLRALDCCRNTYIFTVLPIFIIPLLLYGSRSCARDPNSHQLNRAGRSMLSYMCTYPMAAERNEPPTQAPGPQIVARDIPTRSLIRHMFTRGVKFSSTNFCPQIKFGCPPARPLSLNLLSQASLSQSSPILIPFSLLTVTSPPSND